MIESKEVERMKSNVIEFDYWMLSKLDQMLGPLAQERLSNFKEEYQEEVSKMTLAELKESRFRWEDHVVLLHRIIQDAFYATDDELKRLLQEGAEIKR